LNALFDHPGALTLDHQTPERTYRLATIHVADEPATPSLVDEFEIMRENPEWAAVRSRLAPCRDAPPDKTLAFVAEMDMGAPDGPVVYACPMHPEVVGEESDRWTPCSSARARPSTSYSMSPIRDAGWLTATSPSTTRAG
jgi:hypothetical protein